MPWVQVFTREVLPIETRSRLAKRLSTTILKIEIGHPTERAHALDWMWFHTLPRDAWAVGGEFDDTYVRGRTMCFAEIIAPEAFMNTELRLKAIADVTNDLKEELGLPQGDDGSGIWVILTEVPRGHWGAAGRTLPLAELIDVMGSEVSEPRRAEMKAHFDGYDKMKSTFKIPS
jgi:phenylpyruvate tautomerase PptA (4-oxalocrotonate tautomerase family)